MWLVTLKLPKSNSAASAPPRNACPPSSAGLVSPGVASAPPRDACPPSSAGLVSLGVASAPTRDVSPPSSACLVSPGVAVAPPRDVSPPSSAGLVSPGVAPAPPRDACHRRVRVWSVQGVKENQSCVIQHPEKARTHIMTHMNLALPVADAALMTSDQQLIWSLLFTTEVKRF